jgi:hypothetical protein
MNYFPADCWWNILQYFSLNEQIKYMPVSRTVCAAMRYNRHYLIIREYFNTHSTRISSLTIKQAARCAPEEVIKYMMTKYKNTQATLPFEEKYTTLNMRHVIFLKDILNIMAIRGNVALLDFYYDLFLEDILNNLTGKNYTHLLIRISKYYMRLILKLHSLDSGVIQWLLYRGYIISPLLPINSIDLQTISFVYSNIIVQVETHVWFADYAKANRDLLISYLSGIRSVISKLDKNMDEFIFICAAVGALEIPPYAAIGLFIIYIWRILMRHFCVYIPEEQYFDLLLICDPLVKKTLEYLRDKKLLILR